LRARPARRRTPGRLAQCQRRDTRKPQRRALPAIPARASVGLERRLGDHPAMTWRAPMITMRRVMAAAGVVTSLASSAAQAQDLGLRPLRYGNTSPWHYDNRDDDRDYPTNGFFPGNFSANPSTSWLGIAGALAGNSERSVYPYPSQVVIGSSPYPGCARLR